MRRTTAIVMLVLTAMLIAGCSTLSAVGAMLGSQVTFTQPQLQQSLNRNFPKRYEKLGGLVTLNLMNPRLSIPHGDTRLRLDFDVGFAGPGSSDATTPSGRFALTSAPAESDHRTCRRACAGRGDELHLAATTEFLARGLLAAGAGLPLRQHPPGPPERPPHQLDPDRTRRGRGEPG
jgi:hypothetical protein